MWNGLSNFSSELNVKFSDSLDDLPDVAEKTTLIIIPYLDFSDEDMSEIERFIETGGTLLLMDDYGYGNRILEFLGVASRFTNKPMLDPLFNYRSHNMPRITDFAPSVNESGIEVILLNHATALTNIPESAQIAWSSSSSFLDINENQILDPDEPEGPFIIAAEFRLSNGTLALVSDPSILLNTMIDRDDNYSFIEYLTRYQENKEILISTTCIPKVPLDTSKMILIDSRRVLSNPYALVGITAFVFVIVSRYTLKKEDIIG